MTPHDDSRVYCSRCHHPRWPVPLPAEPEKYICALCQRQQELAEGLARSPEPAA